LCGKRSGILCENFHEITTLFNTKNLPGKLIDTCSKQTFLQKRIPTYQVLVVVVVVVVDDVVVLLLFLLKVLFLLLLL